MKRICQTVAAVCSMSVLLPGVASASQVGLSVAMSNPVLKSDKKQTAYVKVGLTGFSMPAATRRVPVNVALVLDKSGSMNGRKIEEAKQAAIQAVSRLDKDDIVSVIVYDSTVQVLVPATKMTDREDVCRKISSVSAGGRTALFAGVSKGAAELRKFLDSDRVNRIVLLSDGLANVGPSSPSELGSLGASLKKEGVSVTTMGLGLDYNEDVMVQLASHSGGNHIFIEDETQIAGFFKEEFDTVLSVVAQEVAITIDVKDGIRPVRVLGNQADINGQKVVASLTQIYSDQEKFLILEVEVPASPEGKPRDVANVSVSYDNMLTRRTDELKGLASVNFSRSDRVVSSSVNAAVLEASILLVANERNKDATIIRDRGDIKAARQILMDNGMFLRRYAEMLKSDELDRISGLNYDQSKNIEEAGKGSRARKLMLSEQYRQETQQSYSNTIPPPSQKPASKSKSAQ